METGGLLLSFALGAHAAGRLLVAASGPWWAWLRCVACLAGARCRDEQIGAWPLHALSGAALSGLCVGRANDSGILVLSFLLVELFDSFSLLGGKLFGRNLLAPRISPRKTWEGFGLRRLVLSAWPSRYRWLIKTL